MKPKEMKKINLDFLIISQKTLAGCRISLNSLVLNWNEVFSNYTIKKTENSKFL